MRKAFLLALTLTAGLAPALCSALGASTQQPLSLPSAHANPAEIKFVAGHVVLVHRAATRVPGPTDSSVAVLDRRGRELLSVNPGLDVPDTKIATVEGATLTPRGVLVISANVISSSGQGASVLLEYDVHQRTLIRTVRVNPIACLFLAADDTSIWCLGLNIEKHNAGRRDFDVLYQFSLSGKLVGSMVPTSDFPERPLAELGPTDPQLLTSDKRVVAWLPSSATLLLWSPEGTGLRRFSAAPRASEDDVAGDQLALLPGGRVIGALSNRANDEDPTIPRQGLFMFARDRKFEPLQGYPGELPPGYRLIGTDGDDLVLFAVPLRSLVWLSPTTQK